MARPAVDEVVDLVDEEERSVEGGRVAQARERDDGVERVVVVAEDDVGPLGQLERDLERTDLLGPRLLEDEVGLQVRGDGEEPVDEAGGLELGGVVFRVRAVVFVAEDDPVGAHPLLGPEADRARRGGGNRLQGLPEDLLLGRLRREDVELSPLPKRLDEHRKEGRRGLADAGRGLDEELLPGAHGPRHGGHHLALARSEAPEREDELVRLGRLRVGEGELFEELREDGPDSRDEIGLDLVRVPRNRDEARVTRLDVGQDEPSADRASLRSRDGEEVPLELAREAVEAGRSEKARQLLGEVDRLHLVDDDRPVLVLVSAVQASFEDRREAVDGKREADGSSPRRSRESWRALPKGRGGGRPGRSIAVPSNRPGRPRCGGRRERGERPGTASLSWRRGRPGSARCILRTASLTIGPGDDGRA